MWLLKHFFFSKLGIATQFVSLGHWILICKRKVGCRRQISNKSLVTKEICIQHQISTFFLDYLYFIQSIMLVNKLSLNNGIKFHSIYFHPLQRSFISKRFYQHPIFQWCYRCCWVLKLITVFYPFFQCWKSAGFLKFPMLNLKPFPFFFFLHCCKISKF